MPICPVCKSELKTITERHINSNKHQDALKERNIDPKDDPALDFLDQQDEIEKAEEIKEKTEEVDEIEEKEEKPAPPKMPKPTISKTPPKKLERIQLQPFKLSVQIPEKKEKKEQIENKVLGEYPSQKEIDLFIPAIPEPKKQKRLETSSLSVSVLERLAKMESDNVNVVLVNCERCKEVIPIPIPKDMVLKSELPVVAVSYIHDNREGKNKHCLTLYLDHDFDIRRQRISEVVFEPKIT